MTRKQNIILQLNSNILTYSKAGRGCYKLNASDVFQRVTGRIVISITKSDDDDDEDASVLWFYLLSIPLCI